MKIIEKIKKYVRRKIEEEHAPVEVGRSVALQSGDIYLSFDKIVSITGDVVVLKNSFTQYSISDFNKGRYGLNVIRHDYELPIHVRILILLINIIEPSDSRE